MPRPIFIPWAPSGFAEWDGRSDRPGRRPSVGQDFDPDYSPNEGVICQRNTTQVVMNGSTMPTSYLEALMQSVPGGEQMGSSEELIELAHAIQYEMSTLLTPREQFVVEAIVFEQLSLRQVAARWNGAWGKTQVARIRDSAFAKLGQSERLRSLAGIVGE